MGLLKEQSQRCHWPGSWHGWLSERCPLAPDTLCRVHQSHHLSSIIFWHTYVVFLGIWMQFLVTKVYIWDLFIFLGISPLATSVLVSSSTSFLVSGLKPRIFEDLFMDFSMISFSWSDLSLDCFSVWSSLLTVYSGKSLTISSGTVTLSLNLLLGTFAQDTTGTWLGLAGGPSPGVVHFITVQSLCKPSTLQWNIQCTVVHCSTVQSRCKPSTVLWNIQCTVVHCNTVQCSPDVSLAQCCETYSAL